MKRIAMMGYKLCPLSLNKKGTGPCTFDEGETCPFPVSRKVIVKKDFTLECWVKKADLKGAKK